MKIKIISCLGAKKMNKLIEPQYLVFKEIYCHFCNNKTINGEYCIYINYGWYYCSKCKSKAYSNLKLFIDNYSIIQGKELKYEYPKFKIKRSSGIIENGWQIATDVFQTISLRKSDEIKSNDKHYWIKIKKVNQDLSKCVALFMITELNPNFPVQQLLNEIKKIRKKIKEKN